MRNKKMKENNIRTKSTFLGTESTAPSESRQLSPGGASQPFQYG
jgi:hypothetical protein